MEQIILEMKNIEKSFAGVHALKNINFQLRKSEVHALLGGNGAGKSTLIKVLGGIYRPDDGKIILDGNTINIHNVQDARKNGIGIVHQELMLIPQLTVAENIFLGREPTVLGLLKDGKTIFERSRQMLKALNLAIDEHEVVANLTIAQQQLVEITKSVSFDAKILVMDEPTSSLEGNEVKILFNTIKKLTENGVSIIYISHKMEEIFEISDRVTVIRDGTYIGTEDTANVSVDSLVSMMVGRDINSFFHRTHSPQKEVVLEAIGLTKSGVFNDISFHVRKGEILGFAGLVGAGRSEIMSCVFGIDQFQQGKLLLYGTEIRFKNAQQAIENGVAMVPEDRKKQGLVLGNSVRFNLILPAIRSLVNGPVINGKKADTMVNKYMESLNIVATNAQQLMQNLSGGNQQKVVLGKWLATAPDVLILDEPTRGIDVQSKREIYQIIDDLSGSGMAIIMISSELPEIINMCDRVCVVREGKIEAELQKGEMNQETIMRYATGGAG